MDSTLKERYRYTPKDRLAALSDGGGELFPTEIETEAASCLYKKDAAAAAEIAKLTAGSEHKMAGDPLIAANLAVPDTKTQGVQIDLPDNFKAEGILYIHMRYPGNGDKAARYVQRNIIRAGRNASARIAVYHHPAVGAAETRATIDALTCIEAAAGASVEIIEVVETRAVYFETILNRQNRDSHVKIATIDLDNAFLRRNQFVSLREPGSECNLEGAYITDGTQYCDNYIRMHHAAGHCTSNQLFKGVAADEARAIFTGQIYVARDAQKTVALQENHNIVLSDGARVDTRPQLEIYADDVKCNHGATIGRLDPEAIYYMRQRGIGLEAAKRLQIEGFTGEIIDHSRIEELGHLLHEKISKRLQNI
ncbi:Fe-S cluster assembly protein SufD [uncultured Rikenella sp.]|uniref:Fe-S cluster assembly protein SufD n=1 Tax=uncultured Rikenella sp. TaxID=368003 RepID=UPI00262805D1|nr:Fe-S cluster assembly protein SufD [uncultured Rikenella sp.]